MQFLLEWLRDQANILTLLQIFLDLMLAFLVILLLTRKPKSVNPAAYEELTVALERIIDETRQISSEFDANLQERHKLISQITAQLDSRLSEARTLCAQLEGLQQSAQSTAQKPRPEPSKRHNDHHEVLRLARKGLRVEAIARQLNKPLGEVELILKLNRLSDT